MTVTRELVCLVAVLAALASGCSAAQPVAEAVLGKELPCGSPAEADGSIEQVAMPDDSVPSEAEIGALLSEPPSTSFDPAQPVMVLDDRGFPLILGPAWPIEVQRATPQESGFSPLLCQFEISLTDQGLESFNVLASLCFERTAQCPTGRLAVVADGQLIWAPTVQSPSF